MGKRKLKHVAIPNLNTDLDRDETLSVIKTENDDEDCEPLYIVPNQVRDVVLEQISPKKERENQMSFDIEIGPVKIEHDLSSETFEMDSEESEQKQQNWWLKTCVDKNAKRKFFLEFIDAYRSCTALWDVKSQEFADRAQKETEYERLLIKYQEYYPNADVKEMQRKINAFRSNYKREQKRQNDLKSTAGDGESIRPTLYYFDAMSFINNDETPTCSSKGSMSLIDALTESKNRSKRYREKLKSDLLRLEVSREKAKQRASRYRKKLLESNDNMEKVKEQNRKRQQQYRLKKKNEAEKTVGPPDNHPYRCKQTIGKALCKAKKALPMNTEKRAYIVDILYQKYGSSSLVQQTQS